MHSCVDTPSSARNKNEEHILGKAAAKQPFVAHLQRTVSKRSGLHLVCAGAE